MADELPEVKPDPTPKDLSEHRVKDTLTSSEKEVFEGKIKELNERIAELEKQLADALKPKTEPKRPSAVKRFSPL